jgi:hypothetical protein
MIYGFPGQTKFEALENVGFIFRMALAGANDVACFSFVPYPGSELFNQLVSEKKIFRDENYDDFLSRCIYNDTVDLRSWSEHIPSWSMPFLIIGSMIFFYSMSFLMRPWRLVNLVGRVVSGKPVTMLEMLLVALAKNFIGGRKLLPKELTVPSETLPA